MTRLFGIFGTGGCGRGIMPIAREQLASVGGARLVFVDDESGNSVNGHDVMTLEEFQAMPATSRAIAIAIASSRARQAIAERCTTAGIGFFEVRAGNVVEMDDVAIGAGALLSPFVTLTSNIRIG